jgi:cytochrome c oxidase subunit 2
MVMFVWGAVLYFEMHQPPVDAEEIYVVGKQWMWKIQHPNGKQEINALHVPTGRAIRLKMISEDVIHSFYIPAFRVKQDVLPNRYTTMWFKATKPGRYYLFCAEYCGTSHSQMGGYVTVMEPADYADWLAGGATNEPPEVSGELLFTQLRCVTCHGQSEKMRGPSLVGVLGRPTQLADGRRIIADEQYIRESILRPAAKIVAGYQQIMPSYEGQISEEQMFQLVAYLKSLPTQGAAADDPATNSTPDNPAPDAAGEADTKGVPQ